MWRDNVMRSGCMQHTMNCYQRQICIRKSGSGIYATSQTKTGNYEHDAHQIFDLQKQNFPWKTVKIKSSSCIFNGESLVKKERISNKFNEKSGFHITLSHSLAASVV
jgi:hypothetical protein